MTGWKQTILTLKYLISKSKDGDDIAKRILFFLIDNSNGLTEQVSMTLTQDHDGYTKDEIHTAAHKLDYMRSSNGTTHLSEIMLIMGAELGFSTHYGHYNEMGKLDTEGMFPGCGELAPGHENDREDMPLRYTFWLAEKDYGHSGQGRSLVTPPKQELMKIDMSNSELYPHLQRVA
ncbi:MAG: hypothetical protein AAB515_02040 [Patescibacteria group bacterium]